MEELRMEDMGAVVLEKVQQQGIEVADLARAAGVDYNTVKSFIDGRSIPNLVNLQKILWATGYKLTEVLEIGKKPAYLEEEDDFNIRKYRRLNKYYQGLVQTNIDALLSLQDKNNRANKKKNKDTD